MLPLTSSASAQSAPGPGGARTTNGSSARSKRRAPPTPRTVALGTAQHEQAAAARDEAREQRGAVGTDAPPRQPHEHDEVGRVREARRERRA